MDIVLLHGWGLNSAIWSSMVELAGRAFPRFKFHALDLPGYGRFVHERGSASLVDMADSCLDRAPEAAVWVGWSLGGMVALQAAMQDSKQQIRGLQLIGAGPKFVEGDDWPHGVALASFQRFHAELSGDYRAALSTFLLLQSGANRGARQLAREAHQAICDLPDPSAETLQAGIDCLAEQDLREALSNNKALRCLPSQVVLGLRDRVSNPAASRALAELIEADLIELDTGHAPFLTEPESVLAQLGILLQRVPSLDE